MTNNKRTKSHDREEVKEVFDTTFESCNILIKLLLEKNPRFRENILKSCDKRNSFYKTFLKNLK